MGKKKKGARIGNPVTRAAAEAAERKRIADVQAMATKRRHSELSSDDLLDASLDEADDLIDAFMDEYPQWSVEDGREQPWVVTSQIIRAFDGFVMYRNEAAENGNTLDIDRCFEVNNVIDIAPDVREFLTKRGLIEAE
ncbi:TPA: hypothetical protein MO340_004293 [Salmonella enterica subsp. salamae serovar 35:g,m,s,t:-]|nr:hypothetical protein [Salmonella enterica subsp. salamae serovar 35:g,m,s,t:-]HCA3549763.1 hypothetical protein [Salmonella enterica subsp. salamae serovar 35:g,m,s,t:-]